MVIHTRDAMGDTLDILSRHPNVRGVMHSFSGSAEVATELTKKGWYISFSGPVTYKNAVKVKEAAAVVPADRILIETDCPYLTPHPYRGQINEPKYTTFVAQKIAEIKGMTPEKVAEITKKNAENLFLK